jgi:hypothetical protein
MTLHGKDGCNVNYFEDGACYLGRKGEFYNLYTFKNTQGIL